MTIQNRVIDLSPVRDGTGTQWNVTLSFDGGERAPTLTFWRGIDDLLRVATYSLATVATAAAHGGPFVFGGPGCSELPLRLGWASVCRIVADSIARVPHDVGAFEVTWVPNEPGVPF